MEGLGLVERVVEVERWGFRKRGVGRSEEEQGVAMIQVENGERFDTT